MRLSARFSHLFLVSLIGMGACMSKCKKDVPPPYDAGPAPTPVETAPLVELVPEIIDAGEPDADAAPKKYTGPAYNANVARIRQCCNAITGQAKTLGASPEAATLLTVAMQCNAAASALQTNPNAPELAMLKAALAGKNVPALCSGL